jgi:Asp-tRNA(Asn)/Glu-tRNA(Gln) amidotransferase A subunit family amidase
LTRTVADLVVALPPVCGPAVADPRTFIPALPRIDTMLDVSGLRVAVTNDLGFFEVEPEVSLRLAEVAEALSRAGACVTQVNLDWDRSIADGWVRHWHVYLAAFFGEQIDRIGPLADPRLVAVVAQGRAHDAVSFKRLDVVRQGQWNVLAGLFRDHDVLLSPTMTRSAVGINENDSRYHAPTESGRKRGLDMTSVFNWVPWCPALSVPAGLSSDGLPIGMHVLAPPQREDIALRVAAAIERDYPHCWPSRWMA